jgi:hypothetical protein
MATKSNLTIDQGSTFTASIDLTTANGSVMDLTDYTGRGQMRKSATSSTAKDFTITINGGLGIVTLSMTAAYTANINSGRWLYDVEVVSNTNVVTRVLEGIVTVTPEITR